MFPRTAIAEGKAAAPALVIHVLGIFTVAAGDDKAVLVIGDGHDAVHFLDLGARQAHACGNRFFDHARTVLARI
jgi:hypothetical protein